jgi:hypothetical protein
MSDGQILNVGDGFHGQNFSGNLMVSFWERSLALAAVIAAAVVAIVFNNWVGILW